MGSAEKEFNLLYEPWIRVMKSDASVEEVTLPDALIRAHEYTALAGEMPTQDVAMLRLLLAVMHAVFNRSDAEGKEAPLKDRDEAWRRWEGLWRRGSLPERPIMEYLTRYEDRFWLFHPERPFYQATTASIGTTYTAAKLNGEISESSNKLRLFPMRSGEEKNQLTYAEGARWLLHVNGYDDTSAKPKGKGKDLPSVGAGWLGKLGLIHACGSSLFETLMLNFVLVNEQNEIWPDATPIWALPSARGDERVEIPLPDDQAALLTLQSRRLLLERKQDRIIGYRLLGGDFFQRENAFAEQMTLWRPIFAKKEIVGYQPARHNPAKRLWREFSSLTNTSDKGHRPGIITWHISLQSVGILNAQQFISYQIASVQYGDKDFFITDVFSDQLSFRLNLLSQLGLSWRCKIQNEIERCENLAHAVERLALNLRKAAGGSGKAENSDGEKAKEQFFYRVDEPFRKWLITLDANQGDAERLDRQRAWHIEVRRIAQSLGQELTQAAGPAAFAGRSISKKDEKQTIFYSAPKAYNQFLYDVKKQMERSEADGKS